MSDDLFSSGSFEELCDSSNRLTGKQAAFVDAVISGATLADAYRAAYDANRMADATVRREASRLARNPKVAPYIRKARAEAAEKALWSRERAVERLQAVNAIAYDEIEQGGVSDRAATAAFFSSLDRLQRLGAVDDDPGKSEKSEFPDAVQPG